MVVEEYEKRNANDETTPDSCLFVLSAKNEDRLREYVHRFLAYLRREPNFDLASISYTLQTGREAMEARLAVVASNPNELINSLEQWSTGIFLPSVFQDTSRQRRGTKPAAKSESVAPGEQTLIGIASIWVVGEEVDWNSLYPGKKPGRIALPTYPFARERHWVSDSALHAQQKTSSVVPLHPLVSTNTSTLREISFGSFLSDTGFYAVDHQINGTGVFPAAAFLEMACVSGNIAVEQRIRTIKDVVWVLPLTFPTGSTELRTCLKPAQDAVEYAISSFDDEDESVIFCEGKLAHGTDVTGRPAVERMPIEALKEQCAIREEGTAYYAKFRQFGIEYGPSFQTIQEIYSHSSFALSKLKLPEHLKADFSQFLLHPSIIDGALQTVAVLAAGAGPATPHLPFALDELEMLHPLRQVCYVYAVVAEPGEEKQDIKKFDLRLMNESGDVLINLKGLYLRAIKKHASSSPRPERALVSA
jgi:acyl transferase domain-containing protein